MNTDIKNNKLDKKITLKAARVNAGLTQKEFAAKLGICESTYIRWERNPSSISVMYMKKIGSILNYPYDNIIFLP